MSVWQVRIGPYPEREKIILKEGLTCVGWENLPDLTKIKTPESLFGLCRETYPQEKIRTINNWIRQIWIFREKIKPGDLVITPFKHSSAFAVGEITGPYQYRLDLPSNIHHMRSVEWVKEDIPRSAFAEDILRSLGSITSVCQIQRNDAEIRIREIIENDNFH